ncbi:DNA endonuclease RBBP8-like [Temnothorax longispinosus]|uniref:DNA endonuclease RBBP8-like n=1 Tax=Temnothorax longispinosus TaxID=300112 RepID=UPI003A98FEB4
MSDNVNEDPVESFNASFEEDIDLQSIGDTTASFRNLFEETGDFESSRSIGSVTDSFRVSSNDQNLTRNAENSILIDMTNSFQNVEPSNLSEQVTNLNDMDDTENKLPEKKTLLNKFKRSKRKVITKHLNIRCKADRAKLKGSDCCECREYYNKLGLPEEQLQKRKNQISRHRHKYKRPNTPPGFWDPEFPETSGTD